MKKATQIEVTTIARGPLKAFKVVYSNGTDTESYVSLFRFFSHLNAHLAGLDHLNKTTKS